MPPIASLLRLPGALPMMAAGVVGRLPMGMVGLGLTLFIVGRSGSYALAGAVAATTTIAIALVAPYGARLADRAGQTRAIPILLAVHVSAFGLLTAAVSLDWPKPLWFAFAAVGGMSLPSLGAMTRARWVGMTASGPQRSAAFALEAVFDELSFVVGPVVATSLALALFPAAPVLVGLAALTIGGLGLALQRSTAPPAGRARDGGSPRSGHVIRHDGIAAMAGLMLSLGMMFGLLNISVVAFAESADPAMTGVLLAALSFGSLLSGVALGSIARTWRLTTQVRLAVLGLTAALAPLALIGSPGLFAAVAFLAGLNVSTVMIGAFGLVERMVPRDRITEGLAFMASGLSLGMAAGTSLAGVLIDARGPSASLALAAACAATGAMLVWSRSRSIAAIESRADRADGQRQAPALQPASAQEPVAPGTR